MRLYARTFVLLIVPICILCVSHENEKTIESQSKDHVESKIDNAALFSQQLNNDKLITSLIKSILRIASNGFKSGLEASVRGLFDKPMTSAVAAISMVIGAVAILAFYESPISPLPVPPLPDPPVGRFPPEHPIWPPPNRGNQQMSYQPKRASIPYPVNNLANNFIYPMGMNTLTYHRSDNMARMPLPMQQFNRFQQQNKISNAELQEYYKNDLKKLINLNLDVKNNKVIDYNNKRNGMDLMKNQTVS
ncbi:hypothetical protein DERP_011285 [Dermatophagoides pteronyssinus]|uniref:Uncharacterized protein n=1 Tax=Dermatophagoides pteronyssinus TaxID=6956 RepID=A0ABQ8J775_DERPT|nr:hypothetical protein DERP_011285 [Dermatophagoides pteronyssinus]